MASEPDDGKWQINNGQWRMAGEPSDGNGKWQMKNG
jgi:hypothetical protein